MKAVISMLLVTAALPHCFELIAHPSSAELSPEDCRLVPAVGTLGPAGLNGAAAYFPGSKFRDQVPSPRQIIGFDIGERAATAEQIELCLKSWARAAGDRCRLLEYARSHEDRPLYIMIVSSPSHIQMLDSIKASVARIADPTTPDAEAEELARNTPAPVWLAYTIHGDETEGSDAALAVLYWLVAGEDETVMNILDRLVIIIDPLMNPDGRSRFLRMISEVRSKSPNVDDQSLLHTGYWPRGRGNHYLFDLNRDWILGTQPETRGRIKLVAEWNPVLFVDAHGMGPQETHLFSPPREPINPNLPKERKRWLELFSSEQAAAFDQAGLLYYMGEWHEEWYPGYADAYASYRGAVGILYEQARVAEDGVRRPEGRILTYSESTRHHVIGNLANLQTAARHAAELLLSLRRVRKEAADPAGPYGNRMFVIDPAVHPDRVANLVELLRLHGIKAYRLEESFLAEKRVDPLGHVEKPCQIAKGMILIPNAQPLGHLLAAMFEFDTQFKADVLREERQELLRTGRSRIYDITAWSVPLMYGLRCWTVYGAVPSQLSELSSGFDVRGTEEKRSTGEGANKGGSVGWIIDGKEDRSVGLAARLLARGVSVRLLTRSTRLDDIAYERGALVITRLDNKTFQGDLAQVIEEEVARCSLVARPLRSGMGPGELPDVGGSYFRLLRAPRIALVGREVSNPIDYGAIWFVLDHFLAIPITHLSERLAPDLQRYNVIIVPEGGGVAMTDALKNWVAGGGTLIATGSAAARLIDEPALSSSVRTLPDGLGSLDKFRLPLIREWLAKTGAIPDPEAIWTHGLPGSEAARPWKLVEFEKVAVEELVQQDKWNRLFMPAGALVAARCDTNHWLTVGCGSWIPVLVSDNPVFLTSSEAEAPIRYGFFDAEGSSEDGGLSSKEKQSQGSSSVVVSGTSAIQFKPYGWSVIPTDSKVSLRVSGLLWPEAAQRLMNAAWCVRVPLGRGQVVLFASSPTFRASTMATARVFLNSVVFGPGCGTAPTIIP